MAGVSLAIQFQVVSLVYDVIQALTQHRINFKLLIFVFKSLNNLAPPYISEMLQPYCPPRPLRSADQLLLTVPYTRLKLRGDRAFAAAAPKLWNELPLNIRQASSFPVFKSLLKTHFYSLAFDTF